MGCHGNKCSLNAHGHQDSRLLESVMTTTLALTGQSVPVLETGDEPGHRAQLGRRTQPWEEEFRDGRVVGAGPKWEGGFRSTAFVS